MGTLWHKCGAKTIKLGRILANMTKIHIDYEQCIVKFVPYALIATVLYKSHEIIQVVLHLYQNL